MNSSRQWQRLDLNLLRTFDVVYRERSLTRAAHVLSVSQPAISHALNRLREALEDPLFQRSGFGVTPTLVADRLAPAVRDALADLQAALQRGTGFDPQRDLSRLRLAVPEELEITVLPTLVPLLRKLAPALRVTSLRLDRRHMEAELAAARIDLVLDVARPTSPELRHAPFMDDEFCVVAARRRRLDAEAYAAAGHVSVSSRPSGPTLEDYALSRLGIQREVVLRCQNYAAACRVVAASDLLLTMPRRLARMSQEGVDCVLLPVPLSVPSVPLHVYWHRQVDGDPANQWLREQFSAVSRRLQRRPRTAEH